MSPIHKGTRKQESWDQQQTETCTHTHTRAHTQGERETGQSDCDLEGGFGECEEGVLGKTKRAMLASWATPTATHTHAHTCTEQTVLAVVTLMCPLS